ncbi:LysM peptidoglycan-binding domain-containing protein [Candidatus Methylacidiphilum infernorum]|uniref:LysM peptidoglycan-binding domain-containing protein n=1 Tax=Candidatus Methylacidiphilum infernorum TaxID=511746 RepID=A0ABX7PXB4_9BACT|nr:LysM domain-containing protein [Candidatus Methylacidiphilum infernorum]QSR87234.1 LysM peptidoglycan-binding domain-containing protein [Candidatus Methylacidiphilum infernorum]
MPFSLYPSQRRILKKFFRPFFPFFTLSFFFFFLPFFSHPLFCQESADSETPEIVKKLDGEEEKKKLLRAADILDQLQQNVETDSLNILSIKEEIKKLKEQVSTLQKDVDKIKAVVSPGNPSISNSKKEKGESLVRAHKKFNGQKIEKGYYYVIQKNDTLEGIAEAYRKSGVNVSVEDICKANNLSPNSTLEAGKKIFIPKKNG